MDPGLSKVRRTGLLTHVSSSPSRKLSSAHGSTSHAWSARYFFINKWSELFIKCKILEGS